MDQESYNPTSDSANSAKTGTDDGLTRRHNAPDRGRAESPVERCDGGEECVVGDSLAYKRWKLTSIGRRFSKSSVIAARIIRSRARSLPSLIPRGAWTETERVVNASRRNKRYIVATTASAFAVSLVGLGSIRLLGKAKEAQAQRDREAQAQRDREARAKADLEFVDAISVGVNLGHLILKFVEIVARNVS